MNRQNIINGLGAMIEYSDPYEIDSNVCEEAIKEIKKLDSIDTIIHQTDGIQEDVIRYQMICKVMESEEQA